jgi:hypothetical protein
MMAIIRVMPARFAAAMEKTRLYLASLSKSLGLLSGSNAAEEKRAQAWCIRGRTVRRRAAGTNGLELRASSR